MKVQILTIIMMLVGSVASAQDSDYRPDGEYLGKQGSHEVSPRALQEIKEAKKAQRDNLKDLHQIAKEIYASETYQSYKHDPNFSRETESYIKIVAKGLKYEKGSAGIYSVKNVVEQYKQMSSANALTGLNFILELYNTSIINGSKPGPKTLLDATIEVIQDKNHVTKDEAQVVAEGLLNAHCTIFMTSSSDQEIVPCEKCRSLSKIDR